MQGHVGEKVDISARVQTMVENMDGIDFLAFVPRGGSGMTRWRSTSASWDM